MSASVSAEEQDALNKVKALSCYERLTDTERVQMAQAFRRAAQAQARVREILQNDTFEVVIDPSNLRAPWGPAIEEAHLAARRTFEGTQKAKAEIEWGFATHRILEYMTFGLNTTEQRFDKKVWGFIEAFEDKCKDEFDRECASDVIQRILIWWDDPNSPMQQRTVHDGTTLIWVVNDRGPRADNKCYPEFWQIVAKLLARGKPGAPPVYMDDCGIEGERWKGPVPPGYCGTPATPAVSSDASASQEQEKDQFETAARALSCWPHLELVQKRLMIKALKRAAQVQARVRRLLGEESGFEVVVDPNNYKQPWGPAVEQAHRERGIGEERVAQLRERIEWGHATHKILQWMAAGVDSDSAELNNYVWGFVQALESKCTDELTRECATDAIRRVLIWWDDPNSPAQQRTVHDGSTLIWVVNDRGPRADGKCYPEFWSTVCKLLERGKPGTPPVYMDDCGIEGDRFKGAVPPGYCGTAGGVPPAPRLPEPVRSVFLPMPEGSAMSLAKQQLPGWSRMSRDQKQWLCATLTNARLVAAALREATGAAEFAVTVDASNAMCEWGQPVLDAWARKPGYDAALVATKQGTNDGDWANTTSHVLACLAQGHKQSEECLASASSSASSSSFISLSHLHEVWQRLVEAVRTRVRTPLERECAALCFNRLHVWWDHPDSDGPNGRVLHSGSQLVWAVNGHGTRAQEVRVPDFFALVSDLLDRGLPSSPPRQLDYMGRYFEQEQHYARPDGF